MKKTIIYTITLWVMLHNSLTYTWFFSPHNDYDDNFFRNVDFTLKELEHSLKMPCFEEMCDENIKTITYQTVSCKVEYLEGSLLITIFNVPLQSSSDLIAQYDMEKNMVIITSKSDMPGISLKIVITKNQYAVNIKTLESKNDKDRGSSSHASSSINQSSSTSRLLDVKNTSVELYKEDKKKIVVSVPYDMSEQKTYKNISIKEK